MRGHFWHFLLEVDARPKETRGLLASPDQEMQEITVIPSLEDPPKQGQPPGQKCKSGNLSPVLCMLTTRYCMRGCA